MLYQGWAKTTGAENMFWAPEEDEEGLRLPQARFGIYAVGDDQTRLRIGSVHTEEDAAFVTAIHGCFADLCRRLHAALDEADRLDGARDDLTHELMELAVENEELKQANARLRMCGPTEEGSW